MPNPIKIKLHKTVEYPGYPFSNVVRETNELQIDADEIIDIILERLLKKFRYQIDRTKSGITLTLTTKES